MYFDVLITKLYIWAQDGSHLLQGGAGLHADCLSRKDEI